MCLVHDILSMQSVYESSDDVLARSFPAHSEAIYGPKKITVCEIFFYSISIVFIFSKEIYKSKFL